MQATNVDYNSATVECIILFLQVRPAALYMRNLVALVMQELKELAALAYRDTTAENREFWKNEMGQALREIHQVYDDKLEGMRGELETFYNLKVRTCTVFSVIIKMLIN